LFYGDGVFSSIISVSRSMLGHLNGDEARTLEFESANPTIVKSIKQRDFLNTWLRLYARAQILPRIDEFQPARIEDELPDLVFLKVEEGEPARLIIERDGARMTSAFGNSGAGRYLDDYFGSKLAPIIMPIYHECLRRALPVYTIASVDDACGRNVAYERLLLPFSDQGGVTHVLASLKTICEDGGFEIRNLMRGNNSLPTTTRRAVIDRDLFHRPPGRIAAGDLIEFG
jgi:hypothetical protein